MIIFLVGGSKSKKSYYGEKVAEKLYNNKGKLYYLATMKPYDDEDVKRIDAHIKAREGHGYITIEKEKDILETLNGLKQEDTMLLDSITSLITNEMFLGNEINTKVSNKIYNEILEMSKKISNLIIVSDFISTDGIKYDEYTEIFRREIGKVNCMLAELSDVVIESSFGNLTVHKGKERIKDEEYY